MLGVFEDSTGDYGLFTDKANPLYRQSEGQIWTLGDSSFQVEVFEEVNI